MNDFEFKLIVMILIVSLKRCFSIFSKIDREWTANFNFGQFGRQCFKLALGCPVRILE